MTRVATRGPLGLKDRTGKADKQRKPMRRRANKTRHPVELATGQAIPKQPRERFTALEEDFNKWMHEHCTCCVTGQPVFDIAHGGKKHTSLKSRLKTCLPLIRPLHIIEEGERSTFWATVGLPDHLKWAEELFKAFERGESPDSILQEMHGKIDRDYVATLLGEINY